uniref:Cation channel sperm associated 4 n=2 Tax=Canis lupus familiaris TaxID=9615 RepID=A0A8I3NNA2_CANLF
MRATHEPYAWPEEQVLINRQDIMSTKDAWDIQEFITRMYVKQLLRHPAFQFLLALLLVVNAITIALRTNSFLGQKHYELFSTIDDIVLTILICEVLLGWLNGFWIFWKDGWNILNFLIIFILLLGFFINELNVIAITYTLRSLWACIPVVPLPAFICMAFACSLSPRSFSHFLWSLGQVFSVFGVTLFGAFLPMHFQNMQVALYTLFICITQDGWVDIYNDFQIETREYAMEIGGAIYFATFITIGAFIGINLLVVVVTTNLEQMMKAGEHGKLCQINFNERGREVEDGRNELPLVHCVVARLEMSGLPLEPFSGGNLSNLSENTCDNFCLVLEAIQENLMQYKEIRDELNTIVEEVRSIRFNQEQEEELMHKHLSLNASVESGSSLDIRDMTCQQDLITALINREKVQESNPNILLNKHKTSR